MVALPAKVRNKIAAAFAITLWLSLLSGCGGGSSDGGGADDVNPPPASYRASSGVAQKGPLQQGSSVTAQTLDANLAPTGQQFTYQIVSNLGTFSPTSAFASRYVGLNATGYYFDEVTGSVSAGTITLNGYSDLAVDSVLNVNLLTTLAYQRIQTLVGTGKTFAEARAQAEREVLAAFGIPNEVMGRSFSTLDLSKSDQGDHVLAALSGLLVYGNTSGTLSNLIAGIQVDIAQNGAITDQTTRAVLRASATNLDTASVASNLTNAYASLGLTISAADIGNWIDRDGDGLVTHFEFQVADATRTSSFVFPAFVTDPYAGTELSVSTGTLTVNGALATRPTTVAAGDTVTVSPLDGPFPNGAFTIFLLSGGKKIGRVSFVSGLQSIVITPVSDNVPLGLTQHLQATGLFTDGSTADLTTSISWTSDVPSIAEVDSTSGVVTGTGIGTATITATSGSISGSTMFNVVSAVLVSISVTPNPLLTGVGISRTATAKGHYSDGSVTTLYGGVNWSSESPSVASVTGGLVTGLSTGPTSIAASDGLISASLPVDVTSNVWVPAASIPNAVAGHTATLLVDGRVLIVGGHDANGDKLAAAEFYDPVSDSWSAAADLPGARSSHTATLLNDGRVLVVGGYDAASNYTHAAYLYDPLSNSWSTAGNTSAVRIGHIATLLPSGKVLIAGGIGAGGAGCSTLVCASTELYDPVSNSWTLAASMNVGRTMFTATLLASGQVLAVGGADGTGAAALASAEIYDSGTDTWVPANSMSTGRSSHGAVLLANGTVLVAGGGAFGAVQASPTAEVFDPALGSWSTVGSMVVGRGIVRLTLLPNGSVLTSGGYNAGRLTDAEMFDPAASTWTTIASMPSAHDDHTMTLLPTGQVLVVGGNASDGNPTATCELYW